MIAPGSGQVETVDQRTRDTIVPALDFYRRNCLAYGGITGQLTALEVWQLIEKLAPEIED